MVYINEHQAINFKHVTVAGEDGANRRATVCELVVVNNNESTVLSQGIAYCHPKDNFNKSQGRKISLAKALSKAGLAKDARTQYWEAYNNR